MSLATLMKFKLPVKGGRYHIERLDDDLCVIYRVPIFGVVQPEERGNEEEIGEDWHTKAVHRMQSLIADGYMPPLHVGHHEFGKDVKPAGKFDANEVGLFRYNGKLQSVIFADLYVDDHTAKLIAAGKLPYCSVELSGDWDEHEILSLALLDSEPPHFKFPLITTNRTEFANRTSRRVLFLMENETMSKTKTNGKNRTNRANRRDDKQKFSGDRDEPGNYSGDKDAPGDTTDTGFADDDGDEDMPKWAQKLAARLSALEKAGKHSDNGDDDTDDGDKDFADNDDKKDGDFADDAGDDKDVDKDKDDGKHSHKTVGVDPVKFAALLRDHESVKAKLAEKEAKEQFATDVNAAADVLANAGVPATDTIFASLRSAREVSKDALDTMVEAFTTNAHTFGATAPTSLGKPNNNKLAKELEGFASADAKTRQYATQVFKEWKQALQFGSTLKWEEWAQAVGLELPESESA